MTGKIKLRQRLPLSLWVSIMEYLPIYESVPFLKKVCRLKSNSTEMVYLLQKNAIVDSIEELCMYTFLFQDFNKRVPFHSVHLDFEIKNDDEWARVLSCFPHSFHGKTVRFSFCWNQMGIVRAMRLCQHFRDVHVICKSHPSHSKIRNIDMMLNMFCSQGKKYSCMELEFDGNKKPIELRDGFNVSMVSIDRFTLYNVMFEKMEDVQKVESKISGTFLMKDVIVR